MTQHNEPWQIFAQNGEMCVGQSATADMFTEKLIMGAAHVWLWRMTLEGVEVLLQKRAKSKKTWPGYYDVSTAGHIDAGESIVECAVREAEEEIGLSIIPDNLFYIFSLRTPMVPNEIDHVFAYEVNLDFEPVFSDGEVESTQWMKLGQLKQCMREPEANHLVNQGQPYFTVLLERLEKL